MKKEVVEPTVEIPIVDGPKDSEDIDDDLDGMFD